MTVGKLPIWAAVLFLSGATLALGQAAQPAATPPVPPADQPSGAPLQLHPGKTAPTPPPKPVAATIPAKSGEAAPQGETAPASGR